MERYSSAAKGVSKCGIATLKCGELLLITLQQIGVSHVAELKTVSSNALLPDALVSTWQGLKLTQ